MIYFKQLLIASLLLGSVTLNTNATYMSFFTTHNAPYKRKPLTINIFTHKVNAGAAGKNAIFYVDDQNMSWVKVGQSDIQNAVIRQATIGEHNAIMKYLSDDRNKNKYIFEFLSCEPEKLTGDGVNTQQEKTYEIRQEIAVFCERQDVQERLDEETADRHNHNISDIKAHFSQTVTNPAAFSLALSRAMNTPETNIKIVDAVIPRQSLGTSTRGFRVIPLLHKEDTPHLHACIQMLYKKAGLFGKPLIILADDVAWENPLSAGSFGKYHHVFMISKNLFTDQLSDQGIEGGLAHEMGHIRYHHFPIAKKILKTLTLDECYKRMLCHENAADDAAIHKFDEAANFVISMQEFFDLYIIQIETAYRNSDKFQQMAQTDPEQYQKINQQLARRDPGLILAILKKNDPTHPLITDRIEKGKIAIAAKKYQ